MVFGGANYSLLVPEGSYIDALQYQPSQLADLLHFLDSNGKAYNEFFRWQERYSVLNAFPLRPLSCGLCHRLHQLPPGALVESHDELEQWYGAAQCSKWVANGAAGDG